MTVTLSPRGIITRSWLARLSPARALLPYEELETLARRGRELHVTLVDGRRRTLRLPSVAAACALQGEIETVLHPAQTRLGSLSTLAALRQTIAELLAQSWLPSGLWELILLASAQLDVQDLHLEALAGGAARLLVRRDGLLHPLAELPPDPALRLRNRLKVMAGLLSYRSDLPQEGRLELTLPARGMAISARVTMAPGLRGEQASIRLHDQKKARLGLAELGFDAPALAALEHVAARPQGLVVLSGPPASGKSTTMFALLRQIHALRPRQARCVSLEDPIELELPGVAQVQVDEARGLGYARLLQIVLRQDADVILVGEIRDQQTAQLALEAGLTGHLVLTTLHAGSAEEALVRLRELAAAPRLLRSLTAVVQQRLERRACPSCEARGCERCDETGWLGLRARGRVMLLEGGATARSLERAPGELEALAS